MNGMWFAIALTVVVFGRNVRGDDDAFNACLKLMEPEYADQLCCESLESLDKFDDDIKECNKNRSSEELECADFECFLEKQGLLDKGIINDDKAKEFLDRIAKEYPDEKRVIDRVKEECLDGKYEEYPPEEDCMALRFYVCFYTTVMMECESWRDTKVCNEASDFAKKCKEAK